MNRHGDAGRFRDKRAHLAARAGHSARADVRRRLKSGELTLEDVVLDPPELLRELLVFEVLLLLRGKRRASVTTIGRRAARAGINLAMPLGEISSRTRLWLLDAENTRGAQGGAGLKAAA